MSASLVGSEMCIRDRRLAGRGPRSKPHQRAEQSSPRPDSDRRFETPSVRCLLYTSDAADDM
eukprot:8080610-Alexandrium_andersonii.AAC.1